MFELDHPATQDLKRHRIQKNGFSVPSTVEFCPIDFEREAVSEALKRTSFNPSKLSVFSWMGVAPYLTESAIRKTVTGMASVAATGSDLVFDAVDRALFTEGVKTPTGKKLLQFTSARGEPVLSALDPREWSEILADDFVVTDVLGATTMAQRWFERRSDGIEPWRHAYLVHAQKVAARSG